MAKNQVFAQFSGLKQIRKGLIKASKDNATEIRKVFKQTAEIAASAARRKVPVLTGNARKSIKAGTSGANATIRGGARPGAPRKSAPYFGWLDFGGTISPKGTPIKRQIIKTPNNRWNGRYIYPAMRDNLGRATTFLNNELAKIIDRNISKKESIQ